MTQRISKAGRKYTEGSSSTPPADMPKVCASCGDRIYTSRQGFQHHVDDVSGEQFAWHTGCPTPQKKAA